MPERLYPSTHDRQMELILYLQSLSKLTYNLAETMKNHIRMLEAINLCDRRIQMYEHEVKVLMKELRFLTNKMEKVTETMEKQSDTEPF